MTTEDKVKKIIAEKLGVTPGKVIPNAVFEDKDAGKDKPSLGADSLEAIELLMEFEDQFNMEIPDKDIHIIKSVRDAIDYFENATEGVAVIE